MQLICIDTRYTEEEEEVEKKEETGTWQNTERNK